MRMKTENIHTKHIKSKLCYVVNKIWICCVNHGLHYARYGSNTLHGKSLDYAYNPSHRGMQ